MARASLVLRPRSLHPFLALLVALLLVAPAGTASAHDQLTGTEPADGASVQVAPDQVVLTFSGAIAELGAQVVVAGPDGETVTSGEPQVAGTEVTQELAGDLPAGNYEVTWRVTSQDGHPISGTFGFEAEQAAGGAAEATTGSTAGSTAESESGSTDGATAEATPPATDDAAADEADADDSSSTAGPEQAAEPGGLPGWAWVVVVLAALGLVALLARTFARGRE